MKHISFIFLFITSLCCYGQFNINGILINSNDIPIANCSVKLIQLDKVIKSSVSKEDGTFDFQNISEGTYLIEINSFFYEYFSKQLFIKSDISLGKIHISEKIQNLTEVTVSKQKNPIIHTDSGTLIDISGSNLRNRQNILSILNYAPSVSTINGLSILGNDDILIIFDGKQLNLSKDKIVSFLSSIPIRSIENIEVIDRVDSSIDASKSGIIKINTIQKKGWVGSFQQNLSYRKRWGYSDDFSLFYSSERYRVFGTFYHARNKIFSKSINNNILKEQNISYNSITNANLKRIEDSFIFGVDYYLNKNKSNISLLYMFDYDVDKDHDRDTKTDVFRNNNYDYLITSNRFFDQTSKDQLLSLNFFHTIDSIGSNVKISLDFMNKKYINPLSEKEIYHKTPIINKLNEQNSISNSFVYALNIAWNNKFSNDHIFSLGTRFSLVDNNDYFDYFDFLNNKYIKNTNFSNDFFLKEYIFALFTRYILPTGKKSNISLGIRSEYNYNSFNNISEYYNNDNSQWLFNAQYSTKLWGNNFYISALQRLNRANYYSFNPTYIKSSATSAYVGNKDLEPSKTYQLQIGYTGKVNFSFTYRYTENNILTVPNNINGILTTKPENIGYKNDFYIFTSAFHKINDWWEINFKLIGGNLNFSLPNNKFSSLYGEAYLMQRFYLPWDIEMGLEYSYVSNYKNMYTKYFHNNSLNVSLFYPISKSFKLNAFINDIFNSSRSKYMYEFNNIYNYSFDKDTTRVFGISITYEFLKGKKVNDDIRSSGVQEEKNRLR